MYFEFSQDLLECPVFKANVDKRLDELTTLRINRPRPPEGQRYKRDWYDRMKAQGAISSDFFLKHVVEIWEKRSLLTREIREVIRSVCYVAAQDTFSYYEKKSKEA